MTRTFKIKLNDGRIVKRKAATAWFNPNMFLVQLLDESGKVIETVRDASGYE